MPVIADASNSVLFGFDHINRNAPVLIRTPKLTRFEPAQYWGGGPPGNSVVLNPSFYTNVSKKAGVLRIFFLVSRTKLGPSKFSSGSETDFV